MRTIAGLILEKILHDSKNRHLLCWNGEGPESAAYDCGCCLTWPGTFTLQHDCPCVCHQRIEEMASLPHISLWLIAMEAMDALPPFFASFEEEKNYKKEVAASHASLRSTWGTYSACDCAFCEDVRREDARVIGKAVSVTDDGTVTVELLPEVRPARDVFKEPELCEMYNTMCERSQRVYMSFEEWVVGVDYLLRQRVGYKPIEDSFMDSLYNPSTKLKGMCFNLDVYDAVNRTTNG
jgi:hypothetical protein